LGTLACTRNNVKVNLKMKKKTWISSLLALAGISILTVGIVHFYTGSEMFEEEENDKYDGAAAAAQYEFERTMDPALGRVPQERLLTAIDQTAASKAEVEAIREGRIANKQHINPATLNWIERGSYSDTVGPSNGNGRANNGVTSGRMRAILVDANDPSGKTVFIGGVDGGIWKTSDITASPASWTLVNDYLSNLAISDIAQDPRPGMSNIMYFATGESYSNADAVRGNGVFKSIDGGSTWTYLPSSSALLSGTRIVCDNAGNVYVATRYTGIKRSSDGGTTWTDISPAGLPTDICDLELSSTGRMHIVTGIFSTQGYRYTDNPATVDSNSWTAPVTPFPSYAMRAELGVNGNTLYAAPANASYQVPTMYKSTDGGANWVATAGQPASGWASGQGWYSLSVVVNPTNPDEVIVGGLDNYRSTNGGSTWTKISAWVGNTGQYCHADQHKAIWYPDGNTVLFGNDGGIFYSADKGTTIRDRNVGLRLKQFYSVAMVPTPGDYFIAGAQDNGNHQFTSPGLGTSVEITGGDGAIVAIDQDEPQYQYGAYVYNQYRRSTNGGNTWSSVNLSSSAGQFINPFDYDTTGNKIYCGDAAASYRRWTNPQSGSTSSVIGVSNMVGSVTAVTVSPFTQGRVFFGTNSATTGGKLIRIDNADTFTSGSAGIDLSAGLPGGTIGNIAFGSTENNIMVVYTNYGINNIWVSNDGGTSWTASDGNLPDMPVRWALYYPNDNTKAYIATQTGVWETNNLDGANTVWVANPSFPTVRTDMLKYRASDGTIAAATHGRGLWSTVLPAAPAGRAQFDYDGDGKTDISVYRPSNTTWFLQKSQAGFGAYQFGAAGDIVAPADYTGDGKTDIAVWRPSTGVWYGLKSEDSTLMAGQFGQNGDIPTPADFDGDGKADFAVYRPAAQGTFFIKQSTDGNKTVNFGIAEDQPVVGDFDGDGKADIAVYRPSIGDWYRFDSMSNAFVALHFGAVGDKAVAADYTGDGKTDIAVWRPSTGVWYVLKSEDLSLIAGAFGSNGDVPTPGDYDGDGKSDFAVFRPSTGTWYMQSTTAGFSAYSFGSNGDTPTPSSFVR